MVRIRVLGPGTPKEFADITLDSSQKDLEGLLKEMAGSSEYYMSLLFRDGALRTDINILINGRSCMFLDGLKARISEHDVIDILLPMIGG